LTTLPTVLLVGAAAYGTFLLYTALVLGWRGVTPTPRPGVRRVGRARLRTWLAQAGLAGTTPRDFLVAVAAVGVVGAAGGWALFGAPVPAVVTGLLSASVPVAAWRRRRDARQAAARDAWPRMIEEIRILTGSAGRSIPQALFDVGRSAPAELRPAFDAAEREWRLSTDLDRTLAVLKEQLADPTADATCETLLVAHQLGGADLDGRLADLAEDRRLDAHYRKDARAKQAGVRFARRFVLLVPLGMALAGLSVGPGRAAYQTPFGQAAVTAALAMVLACWLWSGRLLRLPDEERVFAEQPPRGGRHP